MKGNLDLPTSVGSPTPEAPGAAQRASDRHLGPKGHAADRARQRRRRPRRQNGSVGALTP